jgi:FkbM family methyltransferase
MRADPFVLDVLAAVARLLPRGKGHFARIAGRILAGYLGECYVTTKYGAKLAIAPSSLDFYVTMKNWGGSWEHWVYDTCKWVMPRNGVFYDIGANVGYMGIELLHELPQTICVAFEPQNHLVRSLARSVLLNGLTSRIRVLKCALSDQSGAGRLTTFSHDGHASLSRKVSAAKSKVDELIVTVETLDEVVEKRSLPLPDLIKIDVEGHEASVLRGGSATLLAAKPNIVFECSGVEELRDTVGVLASIGNYQLFYAGGSYRPLARVDEEKSITEKVDVLAVEASRLQRLSSGFKDQLLNGS